MTDGGGGSAAGERQLLRRIAAHRAVPAVLRQLIGRVERSNLAYRLAHGAFWSLAGLALSRLLTLASSVVTARILGKALYGEFGLLSSTVITFQAFASLGIGLTATKFVAEFRQKDPERAGRILALSTTVSAAAGALACAGLCVFAPWLAARTIAAPQLAGPLRIAAIGLVFTTIASAEAGALAGFEAFRSITTINVWTGLIGVPLAVISVWMWGLDGAVAGMVLTALVQCILTHAAVRSLAGREGVPRRPKGWWREQRVLWTFSLPALAQGIMVTPVMWAAQAILVNQPGGYLEMGALSAANQWYGAVLFLPGALGGAVLPVLSERLGNADRKGARNVLKAAVAMNAAVVIPLVIAGALISPFIMRAYGPAFADAWPTLVVTLATAGLVAMLNPVGNVLAASGRLWLGFAMNSGWAVAYLGATVLLVQRGALGVASGRLIGYAVHALWTVWYAMRFMREHG